MITKVYTTESITKKRKVKKIIKETKTETYYVQIPHSRQVYHGPTSSGRCLRCDTKLYESMWYYQSMSDKYLCKSCWYAISASKREEYRRRAKQGYYSSETYYTSEPRTREITVDKEVEVEEDYTEEKSKLVYPKIINYKKDNKVYINEFSLQDLLEAKITNITNNDLINDDGWYGCKNIDTDFNWFFSRKPKENDNQQLWGMKEVVFNEMILSEKQTLEEFCDVVGFYPNVPAYIQGHPLSMYNNKRKNVVELEKSVTIFVNLAIDSTANYKQYQKRGYMIDSLINEIRNYPKSDNEYIKVNLALLDATYIDGETIIQRINIYNDDLIKKKDLIFNILTSIAFFRLLLLNKKNNYIKQNELHSDWKRGQGFIVSNDDLREILNLMDTDILVGSVEEIGITGIHNDDDNVNFLDSINLLDENMIDPLTNEVETLSVKEVLEKRGIEKLIHVTNKKNLDSIKKNGLLPLTDLETEGIDYEFNDPLRLEKKRDAICLSVTEYNNFLFGSYQKRYPNNEYVVLEIDPKVLLDESVKKIYCDYNAASRFTQRSETNMEIMFKNRMKRRAIIKTRKGKKKHEPTSYQSEILYCGKIDSKYIINTYDLEKIILH